MRAFVNFDSNSRFLTRLPYSKLPIDFFTKALRWANEFTHFAYHTPNHMAYPHQGFQHVLAVGAKKIIEDDQHFFQKLKEHTQQHWAFGTLGYDLKNQIEPLSSSGEDHLNFPDASFFIPEHLLFFEENGLRMVSETDDLYDQILHTSCTEEPSSFSPPRAHTNREEYISIVNQLKEHIVAGDCYEINFCQAFSGSISSFNPVNTFLQLNKHAPHPFSCLQKLGHHYILSASPERFLKKTGDELVSQPIKGTRPRGKNQKEDETLKYELRHDEKELAENMMIVDLVRNDLARSAIPGSVKVEELFGIYTFPQVHQMISTVKAHLRPEVHFIDAIAHAFPMGSMTGAPKYKVMELIDQYEPTKRGAFSGAAGYLQPNGDFDFNVLIRSLFINTEQNTYGFQVGSAITFDAQAEKEYDECLWKAKALFRLLGYPDHPIPPHLPLE